MPTEQRKKLTTIIISIIIILIILLILISTNIKLNNNHSNTNENQSDNYQDEDTEYTNWMNYLLSSNIEEITLERYNVVEEQQEDSYQKITLTPMNLKDIFNTLNDYNLTKVYSMGRGGITNYQLTISYIKDNNKYKFEIINNFILIDNIDNELLNILNTNNYNIVNEELKDITGSFYYFEFDTNYNTSIYDYFFK